MQQNNLASTHIIKNYDFFSYFDRSNDDIDILGFNTSQNVLNSQYKSNYKYPLMNNYHGFSNTKKNIFGFTNEYYIDASNLILENTLLSPYTSDFLNIDDTSNSSEKLFKNGLIEDQKKIRTRILEEDILKIIKNDYYEEGMYSHIEEYMEQDFSPYELEIIRKASQRIVIENIANKNIINGVLRMITSRTYDEMYPEGQFIGLALLQNKNISLREKAIQIFEYWKCKKGISILKSLNCDIPWLQDYVNKVIAYLNEYGNE